MTTVDDPTETDTMPTMAGKTRGGISELGALRLVDRSAWEKKIRTAMRRNDGRVPDAAADLGVSPRNLFRWLNEACFKDVERAPEGRPPADG